MKTILISLALILVSFPVFAGELQCVSSTQRHHLGVILPDYSDILEIINEGNHIHYKLSAESAQRNRGQLPLLLQSSHGDMILKVYLDSSGQKLLGAIKLRVLDERVPLVCQFLVR